MVAGGGVPSRTGWRGKMGRTGRGGGMRSPFRENAEGWDRWRTLACSLLPRERGGAVKGEGERRHAPVRTSSAQTGKEGAGGRVPLCAPLGGQGGKGGTGGNGEGRRHPFRANGGGGGPSRGWEGRGREERERAVAGALMRTPSVRMDSADRGTGGGEGEGRQDVGEGDGPGGGERRGTDRGTPTHPLSSAHPIRGTQEDRPTPLHHAQRGAHQDKGHTIPPPPGLLGPPFSPVRATTFARKEGAREHVAPGPSPSHSAAPPCTRGKGARDPQSLPSSFAQKGGVREHSPHHSASAPALPSCPRNPVRADRGRSRRPPHLFTSAPAPPPSVCATPIATPGPSLPHSHGRGTHEGTPPRLSTSPLPLLPSLFVPPRSSGMGARDPPAVRAEEGARCHPRPRFPNLRHPVRTEWGRTIAHRPTSPHRRHPYPFPHSRSCEWVRKHTQKGDTRGHAIPGPSLPHSRGRGAQDTAPLSASPPPLSLPPSRRVQGQAAPSRGAPFAREGAHEAKPSRLSMCRAGPLSAPAFTAPAPHFRAP
ncbi:hypothetical protein EDB83DRAFT_2318077 [Lactarius deliciosus]|nr:hypothetical protein EDB83DRAFT_2318077 [Lactarius deliciosus]